MLTIMRPGSLAANLSKICPVKAKTCHKNDRFKSPAKVICTSKNK